MPLPPGVTARLEPAPEGEVGTAPFDLRAPAGEDALRFPADGRPDGGVVVLTDDRGRERRVVVAPDTGVVRIERIDG